jgi:hypothetical protein
LAPGEERVDCVYARAPNELEAFYSHYVAAIRPGTHHLVVSSAGDPPEIGGTDKCAHADGLQLLFLVQGGLGPEGRHLEQPSAEDAEAPENRGLAARLEPRQSLALQLHSVNTTEEPLLREAWANLYFADPEQLTAVVDRISFNAGTSMAIPPHTRQIIRGTCELPIDAPDELRIIDLFGHMHAHGERLSLWRVGGIDLERRDLVYESYDWSELELLSFNSVRVNPEPDPLARTGGGFSGNLTISRGERIEFECEFNNTEDFVLRFSASTYTAEMCTVLGTYAPSMGAHWFCTNE